jgi:hypothetical protein
MTTSSSTYGYHDLEHDTVKRGHYNNPLLIRRPYGQVKPTTYSLPSEDYTYGLPYQRDPEGAAELVGYWQFHQPSSDPRTGKTVYKDVDFQAQVDNRTRFGTRRVDPVSTIRFGRATVPSPPVELLTSGQYQRDYLAQREEDIARQSAARQRSRFIHPQATRASLGHTKPIGTPEPKDLWKMNQFRNVNSRVTSASARYAAPANRPTYSYEGGRFPVVRAGMPQSLGSHQYPDLPASMPFQPTARIQGVSAQRSQAWASSSQQFVSDTQPMVSPSEEKEQESEPISP